MKKTDTSKRKPQPVIELSDEQLKLVSGGLNPQPLPPRSDDRA